MAAKQIKVKRWHCVCERCGFEWISREAAAKNTTVFASWAEVEAQTEVAGRRSRKGALRGIKI